MKQVVLILSLLMVTFSCIEKEMPKPMPHIPGDVSRDQIFIDSDYKYQVFYNLKTQSVISKNLKTDWDISITSSKNHVRLNASKFMLAALSSETDFSKVTSKSGHTFLPDKQSGFVQDLSIGVWKENFVYVLDRGYDSNGKQLGYAKMKLYKEGTKLMLDYGDLTDHTAKTTEIIQNENYDATYISFDKGLVNIAPEKDQWHLCFTQYTHVFEDGTPYLVTGVLTNAFNTQSVEFIDSAFANIKLPNAKSAVYSDSISLIGYDWKIYSFETENFKTDAQRVFLVKNVADYYKIHFLDFYNDQGQKGNFYMEYQKL